MGGGLHSALGEHCSASGVGGGGWEDSTEGTRKKEKTTAGPDSEWAELSWTVERGAGKCGWRMRLAPNVPQLGVRRQSGF